MKRIGIIGSLVVAMVALSGIMASSAFAEEKLLSTLPYGCYKVDPEAGGPIGLYKEATCVTLLTPRQSEYESAKPEVQINESLWCGRVLEEHFKTALYEDAHCEKASATKEGDFLKIRVPLCETHLISGQGSSLQKLAQNAWIAGSKCEVHYTASGSAAGLLAFGVEGHSSPRESKDAFIGTDDAPNGNFHEGQLGEMELAALGTLANPEDIVIPVAQAAIAIIVNPPTNCLLAKITNADLQKAFEGLILNWSEFSTVKEDVTNACQVHLIRVVRKDGSGTTYQFKHYLLEINKELLPCVKETWGQLQPETTQNLKWPEACSEHALALLVHAKNSGGGGLAELVQTLSGSIGYAALPDARAKFTSETGNHYHWLSVQNENTGTLVFPGTSAGEPSLTSEEANCEKTNYVNIPSLSPVLADANWSETYGGHPGKGTAKNSKYPICTLTWDVALMNYTQADLTHLEGLSARDYLMYITLKSEGQAALKGHDYGQVEEAVGKYALQAAELVASAG